MYHAVKCGEMWRDVARCGAGRGSAHGGDREQVGIRVARREEQFARSVNKDCVTLEITVRGKEIQGGRFGRSVNASETGSHDDSLSRRGIRGPRVRLYKQNALFYASVVASLSLRDHPSPHLWYIHTRVCTYRSRDRRLKRKKKKKTPPDARTIVIE